MPLTKVPTDLFEDLSVTAAKLAASAVTTAKIADANVTPAKLSQPLTQAAVQATTSGTTKDFTGIPNWAKKITIALSGVSTAGTSVVQIQLGTSSGIETSGYAASLGSVTGANTCAISGFTSGFPVVGNTAANLRSGVLILTNVTGNTWACQGVVARTDDNVIGYTAGTKTLAGVLDRIRLTTVNGTDAFDAGNVNIIYE